MMTRIGPGEEVKEQSKELPADKETADVPKAEIKVESEKSMI